VNQVFVFSDLRGLVGRWLPGPKVDRSSAGSQPTQDGDRRSADEIPLRELVAEDYVTHGRSLAEPGFWAVVIHRLGTRAQTIAPTLARRPLQASHKVLATAVDWIWGIELPIRTRLGRRVRIWHSGSILLHAASIGNDVHIRHDTTFGPLRARDPESPQSLPVIEDGADIGSGACVLGPVTVGESAFVGANSVVLDSVPPRTRVLGVPAKVIPAWAVTRYS
jgi:serine O-acetyltransferase